MTRLGDAPRIRIGWPRAILGLAGIAGLVALGIWGDGDIARDWMQLAAAFVTGGAVGGVAKR